MGVTPWRTARGRRRGGAAPGRGWRKEWEGEEAETAGVWGRGRMAVAALVPGNSRQDRTAEEEFGKAAVRISPLCFPRPSWEAPRRVWRTLLRTWSGFCCRLYKMGLLSRSLVPAASPRSWRYGKAGEEVALGSGRQGRLPFPIRGALARHCLRAPPQDGNGFGNPMGKAPPLELSAGLEPALAPGVLASVWFRVPRPSHGLGWLCGRGGAWSLLPALSWQPVETAAHPAGLWRTKAALPCRTSPARSGPHRGRAAATGRRWGGAHSWWVKSALTGLISGPGCKIGSRASAPKPLLRGTLGEGRHAAGKVHPRRLPSLSKADVLPMKNGVALG